MAKVDIIAAGFSATLGVVVRSQADAFKYQQERSGEVELKKIKMATLFSHTHNVVVGKPGYHCVKMFGEEDQQCEIDPSKYKTVGHMKAALASQFAASSAVQASSQACALIYQGKILQDNWSFAEQDIEQLAGASILMRWGGDGPGKVYYIDEEDGSETAYHIDEDDLDPEYDYDFSDKKDDGTKYERGGYPYTRPYGWDRAALKVLKKNDKENVWLGEKGIRTGSSPGEWAVSYHGTAAENIKPIAHGGYDPKKGTRHLHGKGIYSTPSPDVAAYGANGTYAKTFKHNGKSYKMILQNRVNLQNSKIVPNEETGNGVYFVTGNPKYLRPYGVCLKQVKEE